MRDLHISLLSQTPKLYISNLMRYICRLEPCGQIPPSIGFDMFAGMIKGANSLAIKEDDRFADFELGLAVSESSWTSNSARSFENSVALGVN
ncbi:MAG: hypothetical protein Q9226_000666 [Calogaya cf. arnoldii]